MILSSVLVGCKEVQIFEEKPATSSELVSVSDMERDIFYVKQGTKFASVYLPAGNSQQRARMLKTSRVFYFINDEAMIPTHYKGEALAYKSADISLRDTGLSLERFKDLGYSIGVFGGYVGDDGYYYFQKNIALAENSNAAKTFGYAQADEIRIVSIDNIKPIDLVDKATGVFTGLVKDKVYSVEFYVGSYYYTYDFKADTHFLGAYEYYDYEGKNIEDTKLSYMTFNTPQDLKSGYYNVNGTGLFLYHQYEKGKVPDDEDLNVSYYVSEQEQILQYTKQYNLNVPVDTKDMAVVVKYGNISDNRDTSCDIGGYLISPDGIVYDMHKSDMNEQLEFSVTTAMAGNWAIHIFPRSLEITGIDTVSNTAKEESSCEEMSFDVTEDSQYKAIYADVSGQGDVYGIIIAEDGRTYQLETVYFKDVYSNEQRYLIYRFPYLSSGKYQVKIYHYKSETSIDNIQILEYNPNSNDLIIN